MSGIGRIALAGGLALALAACEGRDAPAEAGSAPAGAPAPVLEGRLDIIAWPGYVERGESDPDYDWVSAFEKATACQVRLTVASSSDEMVALMGQGRHDLVTASGDASLRLVAAGKVQALDISRIPSYGTLDSRLRDAAWHTVDGVHYGVPYQWGPNVLMYNTAVFPTPPASWSVVFEEQVLPDGASNSGRVQAYGSPIYIADAAVYLMGARPELGISDPYSLDEKQYAAVLALLRAQKPLLHRYWTDAGVQIAQFKSAGVVASGAWPYQVRILRADEQPVAAVIPREGATGWADTTMMHRQARHPNCAYAWLEWSLDARVQGDVAAWFGSVPSVPAACKDNALLGAGGCRDNGSEQFDRLHFWRTPGLSCTRKACVPYSRWTEDYLTLMED